MTDLLPDKDLEEYSETCFVQKINRIDFKGTEKGIEHVDKTLERYAANAYNANFGNLPLDTTNLQTCSFNIVLPTCTADKDGTFPLESDGLELS